MMNDTLRPFFDRYMEATHQMHAPTMAGFYAEHFIAAGPKGNMAFRNDEKFLQWLEQLKAFNTQTGMGNMQIVHYTEMPVSPQYRMATIEWGVTFRKTGSELFTFSISYFVDGTGQAPRIIMYISHEDQEDYMREKGLLQA